MIDDGTGLLAMGGPARAGGPFAREEDCAWVVAALEAHTDR
ncbi:hypothetical protein ABZ478_26790 [Streptomyces sp. NPDC005706]